MAHISSADSFQHGIKEIGMKTKYNYAPDNNYVCRFYSQRFKHIYVNIRGSRKTKYACLFYIIMYEKIGCTLF